MLNTQRTDTQNRHCSYHLTPGPLRVITSKSVVNLFIHLHQKTDFFIRTVVNRQFLGKLYCVPPPTPTEHPLDSDPTLPHPISIRKL